MKLREQLQTDDAKTQAKNGSRSKPKISSNNKRIKVARRYGWSCWWCNQKLRKEYGWQDSATIEHLVPRSQGGPGEMWNLAASCYRCNLARGTMNMDEFAVIARNYGPDTRCMEEARRVFIADLRRKKNEQKRLAKLARMSPPSTNKTWWDKVCNALSCLIEHYSVDTTIA